MYGSIFDSLGPIKSHCSQAVAVKQGKMMFFELRHGNQRRLGGVKLPNFIQGEEYNIL